ncbi:MAG TPA: methionine synthase [Jiangellales bacterium]|nr:methionine synthase [Jiangellales bacterium]
MTDERAWAAGAATGIGSLPLDDVDEACRVVVGELPDLPHLPELPGRGPGAGLVGRTVALLVDLHADVQPSGWRLVDRPGRDEERAVAWLRRDLDALEIAAHGWSGPMKLQVAGPLTTAASLERLRGDRAVGDPGARRDLAQSLAEGVGAHAADVRRRLPGARPVVQLDEPGLPVVLSGGLPTASGLGRLAPVDTAEAATLLATVLDAIRAAGAVPVVHCCAAGVPVGLLRRAGAEAVSLDVGQLLPDDLEELAAAVDDGLGLWAGVVPVTEPSGEVPTDAGISRQVLSLWRRLDQPATAAPDRVVVTPECGLAGASPTWARRAYGLARGAAKALGEAAHA